MWPSAIPASLQFFAKTCIQKSMKSWAKNGPGIRARFWSLLGLAQLRKAQQTGPFWRPHFGARGIEKYRPMPPVFSNVKHPITACLEHSFDFNCQVKTCNWGGHPLRPEPYPVFGPKTDAFHVNGKHGSQWQACSFGFGFRCVSLLKRLRVWLSFLLLACQKQGVLLILLVFIAFNTLRAIYAGRGVSRG